MPRVVVEWIEFEAPLTETWPPQHHKAILIDSPLRESNPTEYAASVIRKFMDRAYRRPATDREVERFARIFKMVSAELPTFEAAMRETLSMVLISPQFLYHTRAERDGSNRQYQLASRLSYFLWQSMPDSELLALAAKEKLDSPDEIARQVKRMLDDPRCRDSVRNFVMQWLSLSKMKTVPINKELFPRFLYYVPRGERAGTEEPYRPTIRDYMIDETVGFIAELIRSNRSVLQIVDSDFVYINQPLAAHYGVPGVEGIHFRWVPVAKEHHLGGLLTHGSVLIGNGTGTAPHPIYRAVWLREAILGDEVAPPPAEVPALSDSAGDSAETALSIKELLEKHRQNESCNSCHARLDPWGIPFEKYNAIGQYQPKVPKEGTRVSGYNSSRFKDREGYESYLQSIYKVQVDARSRIPSGETIDGVDSLKTYLLANRKEQIARNITRRLLTYAIGRELGARDRKIVDDILSNAKRANYRWQDLMVLVCQSSTFRDTKVRQNTSGSQRNTRGK